MNKYGPISHINQISYQYQKNRRKLSCLTEVVCIFTNNAPDGSLLFVQIGIKQYSTSTLFIHGDLILNFFLICFKAPFVNFPRHIVIFKLIIILRSSYSFIWCLFRVRWVDTYIFTVVFTSAPPYSLNYLVNQNIQYLGRLCLYIMVPTWCFK